MERKAVKIINGKTREVYVDRGPGRGVPRPGGVVTMTPHGTLGVMGPNGGTKTPRRSTH